MIKKFKIFEEKSEKYRKDWNDFVSKNKYNILSDIRDYISELKVSYIDLRILDSAITYGGGKNYIYSIDDTNIEYYTKDGGQEYVALDDVSFEILLELYELIENLEIDDYIQKCLYDESPWFLRELCSNNVDKIDFNNFCENEDIFYWYEKKKYSMEEFFESPEIQRWILENRLDKAKWLFDNFNIDDDIKDEFYDISMGSELGTI